MNHWKNSMWVFKQVSLSNFAWIFSDMSKNLKDCGQDLSNLYDYILLAFRIKILTFSKKLLFLILYRVSLLLKKETVISETCWSWSISEPDVDGEGLAQEQDSGNIERMGLFLKKYWLDLVTWLNVEEDTWAMRVTLNWLSCKRSTVLLVASGLKIQDSVGFRITYGSEE